MNHAQRRRRDLFLGLGFLAPNILGVLVFVVFPVVFSIGLAFTNWDLKKHNMWHPGQSPGFVGLDNFVRLINEGNFLTYLGNTLFMMMAIPFGIAASLMAAMLLSQDTRGGGGRVWVWLLATAGLVAGACLLAAAGLGGTGMTLLLVGLAAVVLLAGTLGGNTVYRTLFYAPAFTAGVATFILWKKLFSPQNGPINDALAPVVGGLGRGVAAVPAGLVQSGLILGAVLSVALLAYATRVMIRMWRDGDAGTASLVPGLLMVVPAVVVAFWAFGLGGVPTPAAEQVRAGVASVADPSADLRAWAAVARSVVIVGTLVALVVAVIAVGRGRSFGSRATEAMGTTISLSLATMTAVFVLVGLGAVCLNLPGMAAAEGGLQPPKWLNDYDWAKPSLMLMGFWAAIGSANMLLYLAALTNVPGELYEAADIDGASRFARFWHVTWPQLAPTTFFIAVMSVIGGLQGGFESARTMTQGGPAGSTTTLSYFIYTEGFETGRFSFASAVAWALFILVLAVTMFNWKFGNKYVND